MQITDGSYRFPISLLTCCAGVFFLTSCDTTTTLSSLSSQNMKAVAKIAEEESSTEESAESADATAETKSAEGATTEIVGSPADPAASPDATKANEQVAQRAPSDPVAIPKPVLASMSASAQPETSPQVTSVTRTLAPVPAQAAAPAPAPEPAAMPAPESAPIPKSAPTVLATVPRTPVSNRPTNQIMMVRTTAYTHTEADHLKYGRKSAAGTNLQYGSQVRSAAADWSKYPLGTRFMIEGLPYEYVVDDYGSALVGTETIDIYKPEQGSMNNWGVRNVPIRVLEWGSFDESRKILDSRKHVRNADHVRKMLNQIESKALASSSASG